MGWTLIVIGLALIVWSCFVTTTVHSEPTYVAGITQEATDTYNLGLLQQQMMLLHAGLTFLLAGTIAACIAQLRYAMRAAGTAHFIGIWETEAPKPVSAVPILVIQEGAATE